MLAARFIRVSVLYAILGMALGIFMAASTDHSQLPTHAHLNLLGFVSMFLFGIFYKLHPHSAEGKLPALHFWISNIGMIGLVSAVFVIYSGNEETGEPIAGLFSVVVLLGMLLFAKIVFSATKTD